MSSDPLSVDVEFVGGPADGQTWTVRTRYMGRPPDHLRVPVEPGLCLNFIDEPDPTHLEPNTAVYRAEVISDERHTWLYSYRGMQ